MSSAMFSEPDIGRGSSLVALTISGLRSYSPNERQTVEFTGPLTIIAGPNGSGKTTIIEALKYACTGEFPPGSKGAWFVNDPSVARSNEVRAQVRLQFKDVSGGEVVVTRSLQCTKKPKKLEYKSLEGTIMRKDPRTLEMNTISSKCVEVDSLVQSYLGVSKPVLNNVIFCHQEESNWPLSEAKSLKSKFDEIFDATRYIKAIDSMKDVQKQLKLDHGNKKTQIVFLETQKRQADSLKIDLTESVDRLESTKNLLISLQKKLDPIEDELKYVQKSLDQIQHTGDELGKLKGQRGEIESAIADFRNRIGVLFDGNLHDLKKEIRKFESEFSQKNDVIAEIQEKIVGCKSDLTSKQTRNNALLQDQGRLLSEAEAQAKRISERDEMMYQLVEEYQITGFPRVSKVDKSTFDHFKNKMTELMNRQIAKHTALKDDFTKRVEVASAEVERYVSEIASLRQKIDTFDHDLETYASEESQQNQLLGSARGSASILKRLTAELEEEKAKVEELKRKSNVEQNKRALTKLQGDIAMKDRNVEKLKSQYKIAMEEQKVRQSLKYAQDNLLSKSEERSKLYNSHQSMLDVIFANRSPLTNIQETLSSRYSSKEKDMKTFQKNEKDFANQKSSKEQELKMLRKQKLDFQSEIDVFDERLMQISCDSDEEMRPIPEELSIIDEKIKSKEYQKSCSEGTKYVFDKFVSRLRSGAGGDGEPAPKSSKSRRAATASAKCTAKCPVCKQSIDEKSQLDTIINDLTAKIDKLPQLLADYDTELDAWKARQRNLVQLQPEADRIAQLRSVEVPALTKRIDTLEADLQLLCNKITKNNTAISECEFQKNAIINIQKDAGRIDSLAAECSDLKNDEKRLKNQLNDSDNVRPADDLFSELEKKEDELTKLRGEINAKQGEIHDFQQKLMFRERQLNSLNQQKLEAQESFANLKSIQNKLDDIEKSKTAAIESKSKCQSRLGPLEQDQSDAKERKSLLEQERMTVEETSATRNRQLLQNINDARTKNKEIIRYVNNGDDEKIEKCKKDLMELSVNIDSLNNEIVERQKKYDQIQNDMAERQLKKNDLEENLRMLNKEIILSEIVERIDELSKKSGGFDFNALRSTRIKLTAEKEKHKSQHDSLLGRETEIKSKIKGLKSQLAHKDYVGVDENLHEKKIQLKTIEIAGKDLDLYSKVLDTAIIKFHKLKMREINLIIRNLWQTIYRGSDIDYIEIKAHEDMASQSEKRKVYNYHLAMIRGANELEMRGRCSAGQKVLASLIIRIALAQTFSTDCNILALDEPTTNLDQENIESLAEALTALVKVKSIATVSLDGAKSFEEDNGGMSTKSNLQLVVITHDNDLVEKLLTAQAADSFHQISKNQKGHSQIVETDISAIR